jgi:tRNA nucleotidyltransferase/poly(A) polymerase
MKFYEVGGCVRDQLMGMDSKDVDFAVEAASFEEMESGLKLRGFKIFLSTPEFLTIRAQVPSSEKALLARTKVADFVLCRKDSATGDGRRPDFVEPGTILDDLARRDFTMNAIAKDVATGETMDPHGGGDDIKNGLLKFVGDPMRRISEDGLRVLRGLRFLITKNLIAHSDTDAALASPLALEMLQKVSIERVREELEKMFAHDTIRSVKLLANFHPRLHEAIFRDGLRLMPTLKER